MKKSGKGKKKKMNSIHGIKRIQQNSCNTKSEKSPKTRYKKNKIGNRIERVRSSEDHLVRSDIQREFRTEQKEGKESRCQKDQTPPGSKRESPARRAEPSSGRRKPAAGSPQGI